MPRELLLTAPHSLELARYEERPLREGEVRAEATVSGVSIGTELALFRGDSPFRTKRFDNDLRLFVEDASAAFPTRLGYEWIGVVRELGAGVATPQVGERIHVPLPHRETQTFAAIGTPWLSLPNELSDERATLLQSTAIALQAVHDAEVRMGDGVAVFGLGTFGLLAVQLARLDGAALVVAVDPVTARRELALAYGADLALDPAACDVGLELKRSGHVVDAAIEFSGRYEALQQALRCVRVAGLVVAAGFYVGDASPLRLGEEWLHNRLTMVASMQGWGVPSRQAGWDRQRLRATAAELLESGSLRSDELLTERAPFTSAPEIYAADRRAAQRDAQGRADVLSTYRAAPSNGASSSRPPESPRRAGTSPSVGPIRSQARAIEPPTTRHVGANARCHGARNSARSAAKPRMPTAPRRAVSRAERRPQAHVERRPGARARRPRAEIAPRRGRRETRAGGGALRWTRNGPSRTIAPSARNAEPRPVPSVRPTARAWPRAAP